MSAGDTIKCSGLDDAFEYMDALIRQGYEVELEHSRRSTTITIREVPDGETD